MLGLFEKNIFYWDKFETQLKSWIGTPYKSTQMTKGYGVDCLSFVGCCLLETFNIQLNKQIVLDYILPNQWHLHSNKQRLISTACSFILDIIKKSFIVYAYDDVSSINLQRGDVLFFKIKGYKPSCHVGVYLGNNKYIHSNVNLGVIEEDVKSQLITHILRIL